MSLERRDIRIIQPRSAGGAQPERAPAREVAPLTSKVSSGFLERVHIPAICSIEKRSYSNPWSDPFIASEFEKDISYRPALFLNGEVVGYSFNYVVADELHILNLAIHPRWRRMGLGAQLLANILDGAAARGCSFGTLEVRVGNLAARKLYERFGFRPVSIRRGYYSDNGEDALVLERALGVNHPLVSNL